MRRQGKETYASRLEVEINIGTCLENLVAACKPGGKHTGTFMLANYKVVMATEMPHEKQGRPTLPFSTDCQLTWKISEDLAKIHKYHDLVMISLGWRLKSETGSEGADAVPQFDYKKRRICAAQRERG